MSDDVTIMDDEWLIPEFSEELLYNDDISDDIHSLSNLSATIDDLQKLHDTISVHGITPSLMHFTNRDLLLSSAIPVFEDFRSIDADISANALEVKAAQEALGSKIKELAASWFAKAWSVAKSLFDKFKNVSESVGEHAKKGLVYIKDKVYSAAKATGTFVRAHPIASAFMAIAAIAAIGLVINTIWGIPLPESMTDMNAWKSKVNSVVNSGLSKFGIVIKDNALSQKILFEKRYAKLIDLGYSENEAKKLLDAAARVASGDSTVSGATRRAAEHAANLLKDVKDDLPGYASKREAIGILLNFTKTLVGNFLIRYQQIIILSLSLGLRIWLIKRAMRTQQ